MRMKGLEWAERAAQCAGCRSAEAEAEFARREGLEGLLAQELAPTAGREPALALWLPSTTTGWQALEQGQAWPMRWMGQEPGQQMTRRRYPAKRPRGRTRYSECRKSVSCRCHPAWQYC